MAVNRDHERRQKCFIELTIAREAAVVRVFWQGFEGRAEEWESFMVERTEGPVGTGRLQVA